MARWRAPGSHAPPWIARRSREWRQLASVVDVDVDLVMIKIGNDVQELRTDETKRVGRKREAGVVGIDRGLEVLPAAMAAARARD